MVDYSRVGDQAGGVEGGKKDKKILPLVEGSVRLARRATKDAGFEIGERNRTQKMRLSCRSE